MAQRFSPPSSGANTVCCAALITRSRGTLLGGLHQYLWIYWIRWVRLSSIYDMFGSDGYAYRVFIAGGPDAESRGGGTGGRVGRGGVRDRRPKEGNDERVNDLNGQGNDQGIEANGGYRGSQ
nr:hypothetical protein [Tanacetum cinerariifolium]